MNVVVGAKLNDEKDEEELVDVYVASEEDLNDQIDDSYEERACEGELSSPTDDDDPPWYSAPMSTYEDQLRGDGELQPDIELDQNPELDDSDGSSDDMRGRPRKIIREDEFIDPNDRLSRAPQMGINRLLCIKFSATTSTFLRS